jgi:hypothetical protein
MPREERIYRIVVDAEPADPPTWGTDGDGWERYRTHRQRRFMTKQTAEKRAGWMRDDGYTVHVEQTTPLTWEPLQGASHGK